MLKYFTIITLALLSLSCSLDEPETECGEAIIVIKPTTPDEPSQELPLDDMRGINFYVFEEGSGVLRGIYKASYEEIQAGKMKVNDLPDGKYTFVAWGGTKETLDEDGVKVVQMEDRATYKEEAVEIGKTTREDFFMMVDYTDVPGETNVITPAKALEDLYFAVSRDVALTKEKNVEVPISFVRNTNVVVLNITGLDYLGASRAEAPLKVYIEGPNGRYAWDNSIASNARDVRYEPTSQEVNGDQMVASLKILRLDLDKHQTEPMLLHIVDSATGNTLKTFDLLSEIDKQMLNTNEQMTQAFLDAQYEFTLNLSIKSDLSISIDVIEWQVQTPKPIV